MPETLALNELRDAWPLLSTEDRQQGFALLSRAAAEELFDSLETVHQADLLLALPDGQRRGLMRLLAPDDAADVIQTVDLGQREALLGLLDEPTRKEVTALLAYAEDEAGGLMSPHFARLRPDMSVDAALSYLRRQTRAKAESIYYAYVLDPSQRLLGAVSLRELFAASSDAAVRDVMTQDVVTAPEEMDQEAVGHLFAQHDLLALPVVDAEGRMKGIVTVDDIVDVVREEATEDMHKLGGAQALAAPYLETGYREMLRKRLGWLAALLVLSFCAVQAMRLFESHMHAAAVLTIFVPLIISSGGNSGSQAATLVVRAMALDELRAGDWWRVIRRELLVGLSLGATLGLMGVTIVWSWHHFATATGRPAPFGEHYVRIGYVVATSIVAVAVWGTLVGSTFPFLLRRVGFDPASASAPLVATIVDATGILIYFTVAGVLLRGALL